jgi:hypothetical protein
MWIGAIVKPDIVVGGPIVRGGGWVSCAALTPPHVVSVLSLESFHVFRGLRWEWLFILLILVGLLTITVHTFFSRVTRRVSHVEQGLLTSRFLEMFVLIDLLYVMFWRSLFVHLPFYNGICIGYPSLIYGFYNGICIGYPSLIYGFSLPVWYIQTFLS